MVENELICHKCGITKSQRNKLPNPSWCSSGERYPKSFRIGEQVWCPECFHKNELCLTFEAMDRYAAKYGENALAKVCGLKVSSDD